MNLRAGLAIVALILTTAAQNLSSQSAPATAPGERSYTLEATMLGFRGAGGAIDGIRNPTLMALTGETVRITIVNGELMVHDIAVEKLNVKSAQILDKGVSTSITFVAKANDTYFCTVPGHRAAGMEGRIDVSDAPRVPPEGELPVANGKPLDLGFESGTLENWTVEGDAFAVVSGDAASGTGASVSGRAGSYSVSSMAGGNSRRGTLSSTPFRVSAPYASFLIAGGAFASTRVELVTAGDNKVIYTISGANHDMLRPAVVDLSGYVGRDIFVRVVDDETGAPTAVYLKESPWAHINFDNFRFHASKPYFPNEITPTETATLPPMDPVPHAGLSPKAAAAAMTVPKGFTVKLAAADVSAAPA